MSDSIGWIIVAFVLYLLAMIIIGAIYARKNNSTEDYFLGGRKLGGFVAALSAQASDMSGWLLMGLPGSIYALGMGQAWIAVGLFVGTVLNWLFISGRLRRYTIRANNSLTLPTYFENRFHDKKRILLFISSVTIVVFFLVYTASALAAGGKLFNSVFNVDYRIALTIGALVILAYTFLGGFLAVCTTDFVQGTLMLVALLVVPLVALGMIGPSNVFITLEQSQVARGYKAFLSLFSNGGKPCRAVDIISGLAWGLGYCGMPHILVRFMAVKNEKELNKSKGVAITWVFLSLVLACVIGVLGRAYLFPQILTGGEEENVFINMIIKLFTEDIGAPIVAGLFLCGILAAIMSTADSQLLVSASSVAEDIVKGIIKKDAKDEDVFRISRITVVVIAVLAYLIALDPNSSIMGLVSNAWAGLGAAFGPTVLLSLYWKRTNFQGAVAGIASGALTVIVWDYIPFLGGQTLGTVTGLYSLAVGFAISVAAIVIVSLVTPAPSQEMLEEFDDVSQKRINFDEE
ncbi:MAG: sodium/proline symporter PutP [Lachnospiraceae bacterium]|nr:sodium/proline symporter PutP [Lachnospiraceae bacterium]